MANPKTQKTVRRHKSRLMNYLRMVVLSMGGWHFGYFVTCMNALTKPIITGVFGYTEANTNAETLNTINGMVNFVFAMGALLGTLVTGELSEKFGRRPLLYSGDILALITIIPSVFANLGSFLVSRFLSGIVAGINVSIYSVWLAELLPNKLCGIGGIVGYFFVTLGVLFSFLCQNIWEYKVLVDYWRVFILYPLAVALLRLCCYPFLFRTDTPHYVYEKANKETKHSHSKVAPTPVNTESTTLKKEQEMTTPEPRVTHHDGAETERAIAKKVEPEMTTDDIHHVKGFDSIKEAFSYIYHEDDLEMVTQENILYWEKQKHEGFTKVRFTELFSKKFWKQLLSGSFMSFAQQISGINFFCFYSTALFDDISGNGKIATLIVGLMNLSGTFISVFTTFKFGRKPNLIVGSFGEAIGWVFFLVGYLYLSEPLLYLAVVIYMLLYSVGLGGTQGVYISEVLPPVGVGFAFAVQWAFTGVTGLTFPFLIKAVGPVAMASFFLIFSVFSGFYIWGTAVETKDKSAKAIFEEFNESFLHFYAKKTEVS